MSRGEGFLRISTTVCQYRSVSLSSDPMPLSHGRARPVRIGVNLLQNSLECRLAIRAAKLGSKADRTSWRVGGICNSGILDVEAKNEAAKGGINGNESVLWNGGKT
jgi:hypothetical protein